MFNLVGSFSNTSSVEMVEIHNSESTIVTAKERNILRCKGIKYGRLDTPSDALKAMIKNAQKAFNEAVDVYFSPYPRSSFPYFMPASADLSTPPLSITCTIESAESKSYKQQMRDFHFSQETEKDCLLGIFAGEGGLRVSDYANFRFKEIFFDKLAHTEHVRQAFEHTFQTLQQEIVDQTLDTFTCNSIVAGSSAVICYLDKETNLLYTATLGDIEAEIVRNTQIIRLSPLRYWTSNSDRKRIIFLSNGSKWPTQLNPGSYKSKTSRALGYSNYLGGEIDNLKLVIQKCKVSVTKVSPLDVVILSSKGIKKFTQVEDVIEEVKSSKPSLPKRLINLALKNQDLKNCDNTTVILLKISEISLSAAAAAPEETS